MKRIVDYAQLFIEEYLKDGDIAVDFTMGNGLDTLYLAKKTPHGKVYAFDIQKQALKNTKERLLKANIHHVELILDGHEHAEKYLPRFKVGIFNFGYLPQSENIQPTVLETSRIAVEEALKLLEVKGLLILVLYPGHWQGARESQYFSDYMKHLDTYYYECFTFKIENKIDCPYIIGIEKKREK